MEQERALGWDDIITADSVEFTTLPDGDYPFVVESFERGYFSGSEKMSACHKAILKLRIKSEEFGDVTVQHQLLLHSKVEFKISEFFAAIGQKKKGEQLKMNWQQVAGSTGLCKVGIREYNGNLYNDIKKFYPAEEKKTTGYIAGQF